MTTTDTVDLTTRAIVERIVREHVRRYIPRILVAIVFMGLVAGSTAGYAWLVQPILDEVFIEKDRGQLVWITVAVFLLFLVKGLSEYAQAVIMARTSMRIVADIRERVCRSLIRADLAYFHKASTGALIAGCMTNVDALQSTVAQTLTTMVKDLLTLIFLAAMMFYQDWVLGLISFFIFPAAFASVQRIGRKVRIRSREVAIEREHITGFISDMLRGIRHIKAYGQEGHHMARLGDRIHLLFRRSVRTVKTSESISPIMESLAGIAIGATIVYGGLKVIEGTTTPGAFFSFITALLLAYRPLKSFARLNNTLQQGLAAAQRVFALIDIRPAIQDRENARPLSVEGGTVRFDDVSFAYHDKPILDHVSFEAPAGQTTALVGPSGAGKSTALNLVARFYDVDRGEISIDGFDVRDVTLTSLRDAVAVVSQEVVLFNDTIEANIAFGKPNASPDEIQAAARIADAHHFIENLDHGYGTLIGENGIRLSGGQRQRISIARAVLRDAPILILDEATSSLDSESERQVQQALARLTSGRTSIVVAHRLSTIADADVIHVLNEGRIVESGTHDTLLAHGGLYAQLSRLQPVEEEGVDGSARVP
ncbi:MAG: ABC transporter ATP-binding protein [bacterium]|nr:ABC transporter ATP-binding protein [bacterium]MDE0239997.1 ABC transporter ATP-binding protein [bacterium]